MSVAIPVIDHLDIVAKEIYLLTGVRSYHPVEDIYKEIRYLRKTDESLRVTDMPVSAAGNVPKGGGKYTPRYAIFNNGWKVVPEDVSHTLEVTGEQITDDGQSGAACVSLAGMSPGTNIFINYYPPSAEIVRDEVSLGAIQQMSFFNEVWHDVALGYTVAQFAAMGLDPGLLGNSQYPAADSEEAYNIAVGKKIKSFLYTGPHTMDKVLDLTGYQIHGHSANNDTIYFQAGATIKACEIRDMTVSGYLDGETILRDCIVDGIDFFNGILFSCALTTAPIILAGTEAANLFQCYSAVPGGNARPQINFNGQETPLAVRDYYGGLELVNKTTANGEVSIDLSSGTLYIRSSCTAGEITVRGVGRLIDESGPGCTVKSEGLLDPSEVHTIRKHTTNKAVISPDGLTVYIYDDDDTTIIHTFNVTADKKTRVPA
jgi:hypothetical protein